MSFPKSWRARLRACFGVQGLRGLLGGWSFSSSLDEEGQPAPLGALHPVPRMGAGCRWRTRVRFPGVSPVAVAVAVTAATAATAFTAAVSAVAGVSSSSSTSRTVLLVRTFLGRTFLRRTFLG